MYSQIHALALFAPVAALMVILPGPDFVLISRTALTEGRARGQAAALGVACGILLHTSAAIIGLSAIIAGSPLLFGLLTWAGIVYLGWIGIASLRQGARMAGSVAGRSFWRWAACCRCSASSGFQPCRGCLAESAGPFPAPSSSAVCIWARAVCFCCALRCCFSFTRAGSSDVPPHRFLNLFPQRTVP